MIVLDANILIRAVLGKRVRQLLETYSGHGLRFYAPEVAYADAEKYLPALLIKRGKSDTDMFAALAYLQLMIEPISQEAYGLFEVKPESVYGAGTKTIGRCWPRPCPVVRDLDGGHRFLWNRGCGLDFRQSRNLAESPVEARRLRRD